jgi:tetratricopeptide (TPR) repeat protein
MAKKKSAFDRIQKRAPGAAVIESLNHQGLMLLQQGQFQAGADLLSQSLAHQPRQPEVYYNLGYALQQLGLFDSAIQAYGQAVALTPDDADALMARGHVFATQQRYNEAVTDFTKATKLAPHNPDAWNNLGNVLQDALREEEAKGAYDKALALRPGFAQAWFNKGKALGALERYPEADAAYDKALALNPDYEEAKWHQSWVKLVQGNFAAGSPLFEARWRVPALGNQRRYPQLPQWLGQAPLAGKQLLLYAEQGLGDTLQYCRYVPVLQAMGANVSMAVQAPLVSLLAAQWPGVEVAAAFEDLSGFDCATPLMSLPLALGTTVETIPPAPYLQVPEADTTIPQTGRPRVGLVWSGSTGHKNDKARSMALPVLAPLFELPIDWVCLQPDLREADQVWLNAHPEVVLAQPVLTDFAVTARVIAGLDWVVTVDTAVAHLAGALGKPVWLLLPTGADYRWLLARADTPWYPSMRLFRQTQRGDWPGVVAQVSEAIQDKITQIT